MFDNFSIHLFYHPLGICKYMKLNFNLVLTEPFSKFVFFMTINNGANEKPYVWPAICEGTAK